MLKKDIATRCRELLHSGVLKEEDKKFLMEVIRMHPRSFDKVGCGIKDFFIGSGCFWIRRADNSITDFSYTKCINGKDHPIQDFMVACRKAVEDHVFWVKMDLFKKQNVDGFIICPITGEKVDFPSIHLDHHSPKFRDIVKAFIKENNIEVTPFLFIREDGQFGVKFALQKHSDAFLEYHNKVATYRLLSKTANMRIG
jgi:hypothetical protein